MAGWSSTRSIVEMRWSDARQTSRGRTFERREFDGLSTEIQWLTRVIRRAVANRLYQPTSFDKLAMDASVLVVAGAETTATTIMAAIYFLLTNPAAYQKLQIEVQTAFSSEASITVMKVNKLEYMRACLDETMRMLPAVQGGLPRVVPPGSRVLNGKLVPGNVSIPIEDVLASDG